MYNKIGSSKIVNDLDHLGHGIAYTEVTFIDDKWISGLQRNCHTFLQIKRNTNYTCC